MKLKNQMKRRSKNSRVRKWTPPPLPALKYAGPVVPPIEAAAELPIATVLRNVILVGTSPSGIINTIYSNVPSATPDWPNYLGLYQRYRVLGMRLRFVPFNENWGNSAALGQTTGNYIMYTVRDVTVSGPTSYPIASNYSNSSLHSITTECLKEIRMDGPTDSAWQETDNPAPTYGIGLYAAGLSFSASYGQVEITYLVEFYGRT